MNEGDEVILSTDEHASNILPWFILSVKKGIKLVFAEGKDGKLSVDDMVSKISSKTKVISLAHITNVSGDKRDIKTICEIAHTLGLLVVVDAAQSAPHIKLDVRDLDADFLAFSGHKMCGPTGIGVLYGKYELLKKMIPFAFGGGMNEEYSDSKLILSDIPYRFEAGTQDLAAIIGLGEAILFLNEIGMDNIERHVKYLKKYLLKRLEELNYIKVYNKNSEGSTVIINIDGVLSGDLGLFLNTRNICVRSGRHCVKLGNNSDTVRISLYFYNTYEEIDYLIDVLSDKRGIYDYAS